MIVHYVVVGIQRWGVSGSFFSLTIQNNQMFFTGNASWSFRINLLSSRFCFHSFTSKTYTDLILTEISELMNSNAFATLSTPIDI